jgi:hypothetical protein
MIDLILPKETILSELEMKGITQRSLAITYAFCIRQHLEDSDFLIINKAIIEKYGMKGLMRIKTKAWRYFFDGQI